MHVTKGDFDSLAKVLTEKGIQKADVAALKKAIAEDGEPPSKPGSFGEKVSGWLGRIAAKAAGGVIEGGLAAVAAWATHAINQYYGISETASKLIGN